MDFGDKDPAGVPGMWSGRIQRETALKPTGLQD